MTRLQEKGKERGRSIQNRLILLLLFIILPVLSIQAYIYYDNYQAQRELELQANLEIARAVAKNFESFVRDVLHQELAIGLAITSSHPMTSRDITRLLETSRDYDAVRDFTWMNPNGDAVYSGNPAVIGRNYNDRSYLREIVNGREWAVSELVISKAFGKPVFGISRGIRDEKGNLIGVVVAMINPEKLDTRLAVERGKGGAFSLVDNKGMLVYRYPAINTTWEERNWLKQYPEYEDVFKGKEVTKTFYAPFEEKNRLVGLTLVSSIGWAAGAGKREEDVTGPILASLAKSAFLFLSVSIAAFFIALAVSRKITNPVRTLRDHALALGQGLNPEPVKINRVLEFQDLAETFDTMAKTVHAREKALRESAEQFRAIVTASSEALYRMSPDWSEMRQLHSKGFLADTEEPNRSWLQEYIHPDDQPQVITAINEAIRKKSIFEMEHRIRRKDGSLGWTFSRAVPLKDANGEIVEWFGAASDITERKRAEEKLQEERDFNTAVLDTAGALVIVLDKEGRIMRFNRACEDITGYSTPEVLGRVFVDFLVPPEELQGVQQTWNALCAGDFPNQHENHWVAKNGSRHLIAWSNTAITSGKGEIDYIIGTGVDITERKRAEQAMHEAHERSKWLARLPEENPNPIMRASIDGNSRYCNPAAMVLDGWKCEVGLPMPSPILPLVRKAMAEDRDVTQDIDLGEKTYSVAVTPFTEEGYANVYGRDITERKRAEQALRKAKDELEERVKERTYELYAESLYARSLIEASMDPLVTISVDGKITDVNHASEEVTGVSRAQLIGSDFSDYFTEPEKARAGYKEVFQRGYVRDYPLELKHQDGHVTPVLYNASVYRDDAGRIMGVFAAARDITERKRAESALRKLASELVMAEERERKRIAGVLHDDVAQTLAAVKMRIDMIKDAPSDQDLTLKEAKALLLQSIQETRALMSDIGNPLLSDLGLQAACESLANRLMEGHQVRITCDIQDAYKHLNADVKTLLYQVVRELLNNVVKHSKARNAHVKINMETAIFI